MCDIDMFYDKVMDMEDYFAYVNTDIDSYMMFERELYAAYAALYGLSISTIGDWFEDAEREFITSLDIDLYLMKRYDFWHEEELDYFYDKAVHEDQIIIECAGYWFHTK